MILYLPKVFILHWFYLDVHSAYNLINTFVWNINAFIILAVAVEYQCI